MRALHLRARAAAGEAALLHSRVCIHSTTGVVPRPTTAAKRRQPTGRGPVGAVATTFWAHKVAHVDPSTITRSYALDRAIDKRSRFSVRSRLRDDGVVSNLFGIHFPGEAGAEITEAFVHVYEMYATRLLQPPEAALAAGSLIARDGAARTGSRRPQGKSTGRGGGRAEVEERRVEPGRVWRAVQRSLHQRFAQLPPMVYVQQCIYSAEPLPGDGLKVPAEFHDLGWHTCELRYRGRRRYTELAAGELQELVNKLVPWAVRQQKDVAVVREKTGKMVGVTDGLSSNGLRVFRGTTAQAVYVDEVGAVPPSMVGETASRARGGDSSPPPTSRVLGEATTAAGKLSGDAPVFFRVDAFVRRFVFRGRTVESYKISDGAGTYLASLWEPTRTDALPVGCLYAAVPASSVRVYLFPERDNTRLVELHAAQVRPATVEECEQQGTVRPSVTATVGTARSKTPAEGGSAAPSVSSSMQAADLPGRLSLKIDTKGTIASEASMWDEVQQHFGPGPYDEDTQRRIARAAQGTPVVISYSMRQSVIRLIRFHDGSGISSASGNPTGAAPVKSWRGFEPGLLPHVLKLEPTQPCAVLPDYTVVPLQALHCCFDPRMKGWQETAIATLSLMPEKRVAVLQKFRDVLAEGLRRWGLTVAAQPHRTKAVSLLPIPQKTFTRANVSSPAQAAIGRGLRHRSPPPFPTTVLVIGVTGARCTSEDANRITLTSQQMAHYFNTSLVTCVATEQEAVAYVAQHMLLPAASSATSAQVPALQPHQQQVLRDVNAAVIVLTTERESRATRWVMAECLSRGVLPVVVPPASSPRRINLLCGNIKRQLNTKFEVNPLRGVDLVREVPVLRGRRVLVVGIDTCHTTTQSVGSVVGILVTPQRNHVLPIFWKQEARGQESQHVSDHFKQVLAKAIELYDGLDEVIVFQDGDMFSELNAMSDELAAGVPGCGLTFMCLHKRSNIRFYHEGPLAATGRRPHQGKAAGMARNNIVKGTLIPALAPVPLDYTPDVPSFYLQTHESNMSTARIVQYTVHCVSPTLDVGDVQQIANVMANVMSPQATKLPMSTRCAHRLADQAERLLDAVPLLQSNMIPAPLNERLWFM